MAKRASIRVTDAERALRILHDTYWTSSGWRFHSWDPRRLPPHLSFSDFEFAKCQGVMFDAVQLSRAERQTKLRAATASVTAAMVAAGFLTSLSSRRLSLRSALGSFAYTRHFPVHTCDNARAQGRECSVCGMSEAPTADWYEDLNVLNFERHKWGGVRHTDETYAALDLELFVREARPEPTATDRDMLVGMLNAIAALRAHARPSHLENSFRAIVPSNASERGQLAEILALCGVIEPKEFPSYRTRFVDPYFAADSRTNIRTDRNYPLMHWRGSDGVNAAAVAEWFPWAKLRKGKWTF